MSRDAIEAIEFLYTEYAKPGLGGEFSQKPAKTAMFLCHLTQDFLA